MTRLQQHQKKQLNMTIGTIAVLFIIFIIFILTIGFKILLNTSVLISNLTNKPTTPLLIKKDDIINKVEIDNIPESTNSATIIISGSVLNFDQLDFYLNNVKVKEIKLYSSDNFTEEIGELKKGNNEVYIEASSKNSNKKKQSNKYLVFFNNEKPKLEISQPQDNLKTNKQEIKVSGITDKEIFIKINDMPIVVDAKGEFQTLVQLKDGENKIIIIAQDVSGNLENKILTINYSKDE